MVDHKKIDRRLSVALLSTLTILLAFTTFLATRTAVADDQYSVYLPVARGPYHIGLQLLGNVVRPVDTLETDYGLLVAGDGAQVTNLTTGQLFLDLSAGETPIGLQNILLQEDRLYVLYAVNNQTWTKYLSRFEVRDGVADRDSEEVLFTLAFNEDAVHLGGDMTFGPDGYLYISTGDGSPQGDPDRHGQDKTNVYASIMRLDVHSDAAEGECVGEGNFGIPPGNPFADGPGGNCDELWTIGLRQPWRFSFDRLAGDMWIGDVGLHGREEINVQPAGVGGINFGWNCFEGSLIFDPQGCDDVYQFPVHEYQPARPRCAIIGGYVYRGAALPNLYGRYVFADFCSGEIYGFTLAGAEERVLLYREGAQWVAFSEGRDGELYVADYGSGNIFRIIAP